MIIDRPSVEQAGRAHKLVPLVCLRHKSTGLYVGADGLMADYQKSVLLDRGSVGSTSDSVRFHILLQHPMEWLKRLEASQFEKVDLFL